VGLLFIAFVAFARSWILGQAGKGIAKFVETFKEYPPSQKGMSVQVTNLSDMINSQSMGR